MRGALRTLIGLCGVAIAATTAAHADVVGGANVRASFTGWLTPKALPRSEDAPVALHLKGSLRTTDGRQPPQLRRIVFAINRHGKVTTRGLPVCRRARVVAATTKQALAACRDSLVGGGNFRAHIVIPSQAPFPSKGRLLAFNSRRKGRKVMLAHIFGTDPVPTSQVLTLTFERPGRGRFGTTMSLRVPKLGEDWGHVTGFKLNLHRRYTFRNRARSVVSASCPAPKGFNRAVFTAARGTYHLADGRVITRRLTGSCRVRN